ncbi:MAG: aspartate--tRNA ligase [Planctomycetota bacterium]|nr:aspartate--tRNA ligase [Planctomycetota bacterium]
MAAREGSGSGGDWRRTHTCGELREEHAGQEVVLNGWVASRRNLGGIYFVDLRDRYGLTQVILPEDLEASARLSREDCVSIVGEVARREAPNEKMPTGMIEVRAASVEKLSSSKTPPFEIEEGSDTAVELRLRYRYLDIRRPDMQRGLMHRSRFIGAMRSAFLARDFAEVETPILTKATPEGARDYLVPSRVHPGEFYALPQSPQIFKQILMVAGMDRYFQVARCFRDEDLRADRQPEFTQLDMEMSFVEEEDVFAAWEGILQDTFREAMGVELPVPFPRLTWHEAMERYGSDKPDTRFGMELIDAAPWVPRSGFGVFEKIIDGGGRVMGITIPGGGEAISRGNVKKLEEVVKTYGAGGLAWWKPGVEGGAGGSIVKFCQGESGEALCEVMGAGEGDMCAFVAGDQDVVWKALGALRLHVGKELGMMPGTDGAADGGTGPWNFLWVTRFPMFEWDAEPNDGADPRWVSLHHPFTAPADWDMAGDPGDMESRAYDLVMNGWELGSGSIRIHREDTQTRVFELLGLGPEEQSEKFGFLLDALSYGAPPHGGFAVGLDRIVALTLGMESIRDVVAFPKTATASDLMCDAPSTVSGHQMQELFIAHSELPAPRDGDGS